MRYYFILTCLPQAGELEVRGWRMARFMACLFIGCLGVMPMASWAADEIIVVRHDGLKRQVIVHVPSKPAKALPVVLMLHGAGGKPRGMAAWTGMNDAAERHGFITAYPAGVGMVSTWNAGNCCGPAQRRGVDDVGFLRQAVEAIAKRWDVDRRRVYVVGMSNGGMMAYRMAAEAADMVAAVAVVEGTMTLDPLPAGPPVPIMHIHSLSDPRVPFEGGKRGRMVFPPVEQGLAAWRHRNGCPQTPMASKEPPLTWKPADGGVPHEAISKRYGPCRNGSEVVLWLLKGPGHVWPGALGKEPIPAFLGAKSDVLNANEVIWDFFARYQLGGLAPGTTAPPAASSGERTPPPPVSPRAAPKANAGSA